MQVDNSNESLKVLSRLHSDGLVYQSENAATPVDVTSEKGTLDHVTETQQQSSEAWKKWKALLGINWLRTYVKFSKERYRVKQIYVKYGVEAEDGNIPREEWPVEKQGDLELYSNANQAARERNKHSPLMRASIDRLWNLHDLFNSRSKAPAEVPDSIDMETYLNFNVCCQYVILPHPVDKGHAERIARHDWFSDTKDCVRKEQRRMNYKQFYNSLFELADIWASGTSLSEYVQVLSVLYENISEDFIKDEVAVIPVTRRSILSRTASIVSPAVRHSIVGLRISKSGELKRRKLKSKFELIEHNNLFSQTATQKMDEFTVFLNEKVRGREKTKKVPTEVALKTILKLFSEKEEQVIKIRNSLPHPYTSKIVVHSKDIPFDKFVIENYVRKYGSKSLARKHLKRLMETTLACHTEPVFRIFLKSLGVYVEPLVGEETNFSRDPFIFSDYVLPLLRSCCQAIPLENLTINNQSVFVFKFTFEAHLRKIVKRIPSSCIILKHYQERLLKIEQEVETTGGTEIEKISSSGQQKGNRQPGLKSLLLKASQNSKLGERICIQRALNKKVIATDQGVSCVFDLFLMDRKWETVYLNVVAARAAKRWMQRTFSSRTEKDLSSEIAILSAVSISSSSVNCDSFSEIAKVLRAVFLLEEKTGLDLFSAFQFDAEIEDKADKEIAASPRVGKNDSRKSIVSLFRNALSTSFRKSLLAKGRPEIASNPSPETNKT